MREKKIIPIRRETPKSATPLSDASIAVACGTRDPAAITILFDRFHHKVGRYISRLIGSVNVEDLVQSTFVEVVRGGTVYDGRASVTTWLFAIATNIVRHHRRSFARKKRLTNALKMEPTPSMQNFDDNLDTVRKIEKANEILMELSLSQREAFVLCVLEGQSAKETAEILGTSESAVWKRVCKARATIRRKVLEDKS
jgi:RNA polymerase sigma-70 factor, ECF subfamily